MKNCPFCGAKPKPEGKDDHRVVHKGGCFLGTYGTTLIKKVEREAWNRRSLRAPQ